MRGFINDIWWMLLLRGIAFILFGMLAIIWPGLTLTTLAIFFAAFVLITGVINVISAIGYIGTRRAWFLPLILGIIEVGVGVFVLRNPVLTVATFILAVGLVFIIQGIIAIISTFADKLDPGIRFLDLIVGIFAIIAGFSVIRYPISGGLAFAWVLGFYGLITGAITVATSLSIRPFVSALNTEERPRGRPARNTRKR